MPRQRLDLSVFFVLLFTACCLLPSVGLGQSAMATLSGTVTDANGAVVPSANVTIVNPATGLQRQATTNDQGSFTIPLLPPSTYTVSVEGRGFAPAQVKNVVLNVGDQKALNIQLKAGDVNATVTVDSNAEAIRTDGSVGTVVDRQFVANMPLNGRSLQSLISLTPGVVFTPAGNPTQAGGQFSVNGQRTNANQFTVDGVGANYGIATSNLDFVGQSGSGSLPGLSALGGTNSLVSIDALQEFKIQTSSFAPEFGRTPGGQISLLTRSGTNDFHGTVFDYLRNDVLDANDWFSNRNGLPKAKERQNDFGGVIGGPIIKNKTFFFFSYEGLRLRQPSTSISTVPTVQARQSVADVVKPFFNAYPIPNLPEISNGLAQFVANYSDPATLNATSIRGDHSLSPKMTLFGTYRRSPSQIQARSGALNQVASTTFQNDAITVGLTWLVSASITNDLRFNWSRARATVANAVDSLGGAVVPNDSLFFASPQNRNNAQFLWGALGGSRVSSVNTIGAGNDNLERQINLIDTVSWVKGAHQLKFGVDYRRISPVLNKAGGNVTVLVFRISSQPTIFLANIAVGSDENKVLFTNFSAFAQDTWKPGPRFTLAYGLRWDLNLTPRSTNRHPPSVLLNLGGAGPATLASPGTPLYGSRYANFAPRFGLSYQLSHQPGREIVLRGGVGVFYDLGTGILATEFEHVFPYFASKTFRNISYPLNPGQAPPPVLGVDPPRQLFLADPSLQTPHTVEWNAAVEQSLGRNQTLTASYVGAAGRRLLRQIVSATLVAGFGSTPITYRLTNNEGRSDYRALQVQFQRRLSKGLQGLLSYTWGRSYDNVSNDTGLGIPSQYIDLSREYASSDFDVRHSLSGAVTVDLPALSGPSAINLITRGWGLDGLLRFRTALPTNPTTLTSSVLFGSLFVPTRPNVVARVPQVLYGPQYPGGSAVNPAAFTDPPAGTQGNFPRNSMRFFNASQLDLALRRQFSLTERVKLQFRFEFFNIFNHPNFADPVGFNPGDNVSQEMLSRGLGGLSPLYQVGGPRSGQVGLKLIF
jgi:hypothetical protein